MSVVNSDFERLLREGRVTRVEHHAILTSTNDRARQIAADLRQHETALVLADEQSAGRGRGANRWWTGEGSLAMSMVFDPAELGIRREHFPMISLAAAVAIIETVRPLAPHCQLGLHWPNDVFALGSKLAGVLVEAQNDGKHIVGIGLNLNNRSDEAPDEIRARTISLTDLTHRAHDRTAFVVQLLDALWPNIGLLASTPAALAQYADRLCLQHRQVLTIQLGERRAQGFCAGIDDNGALVLKTDRGTERFYSGVLVHDAM